MRKPNNFKPLWIVLIVVASLVLLAVIVGMLNALIGKGQWRIGWQDYTYREEGYQLGGGTVYRDDITAIEVDWIEGGVELLLSEDDAHLSLSEESENALDESAEMRWRVDETGKLTIKFRKSGWYMASSVQEKKLTVRIPKAMAAALVRIEANTVTAPIAVRELSAARLLLNSVSGELQLYGGAFAIADLETVSGNVSIDSSHLEKLELETTSGSLTLRGTEAPKNMDIETVNGSVAVTLPESVSFALSFESVSGRLISDFAMTVQNGKQIYGSGEAEWSIETVSGGVKLTKS